jgi:hypothetical protein
MSHEASRVVAMGMRQEHMVHGERAEWTLSHIKAKVEIWSDHPSSESRHRKPAQASLSYIYIYTIKRVHPTPHTFQLST